jgi:hypothetical protein
VKNHIAKVKENMKKSIFAVLLATILAGAMSGCSSSSPEGFIDQYMKCLDNKDAEGLAHLAYLEDELDGREPTAEEWDKFVSMTKAIGFLKVEKEGGIKSYEIIDVDVLDNPKPGNIAIVEFKTIYNSGEEETETIKLKMEKSGDWKPFQ